MTTRKEIVAMRKAAEDEADHVLQCCGEYRPNYHEVADAIFFREAQRQAYERAAEVAESIVLKQSDHINGGKQFKDHMHWEDIATAIRDLIEGDVK